MKKKRITLQMIANEAGVSKAAVSLALRNDPQVSPPVRKKIYDISKKMGYRSNPVLRSLMTELRKGSDAHFRTTIGFAHNHHSPKPWTQYRWVDRMYRNTMRRANSLGYKLEEVWLGDPNMTPKRHEKILATKQIRGMVLFPFRLEAEFPNLTWENYSCVGLFNSDFNMKFNRVTIDHYAGMFDCLEHLHKSGYKNVGYVSTKSLEQLNLNRQIAALLCFRFIVGGIGEIPPLYLPDSQTDLKQEGLNQFKQWLVKYQPDVITSPCIRIMIGYLKRMGLRVPQDIGLFDLANNLEDGKVSSFEKETGKTSVFAVEQLDRQLNQNQFGFPKEPLRILVKNMVAPGKTTRNKKNKC